MIAPAKLKNLLLPLVAIVLGFGTTTALDGYLKNVKPELPADYIDADPAVDVAKMRGFTLGMDGLIADWYWMRSLQYLGGKIATKEGFINIDDLREFNLRLLYPYLNSATDLDPQFMAAYSFGAIVLPAVDEEQAIAIAKKGIANNPADWQMHQHLGYIYWKLKRYDEAAETYERGSLVAGAPPFLRMMSAAMKTEGGSRNNARAIYRQMLESTDENIQNTAAVRLKQIAALDEIEAINNALAKFKETNGRCADDLREIHPLLAKVTMPDGLDFRINKTNQLVDPTDAPYLFDANSCSVKLDPKKTGIPFR
ncbi:MAG: tetratricopeptide repeat protein [Pyrinomonadaceae bacterium]